MWLLLRYYNKYNAAADPNIILSLQSTPLNDKLRLKKSATYVSLMVEMCGPHQTQKDTCPNDVVHLLRIPTVAFIVTRNQYLNRVCILVVIKTFF